MAKTFIFIILFTLLFPNGTETVSAAEFTSAKLALSRVQASATAITNTWTIVMPASVDWDGDSGARDEILIDYPASSVTFDAAADWGTNDFTITDNGTGSTSVTAFAVNAHATTFTYPSCASSSTNDAVIAIDVDDARIGFKRCTDTFTSNGNGSTVTITIGSEINNGTAGTYIVAVAQDENCGTDDTTGCAAAATDNSINAAIDLIADDQIGTSATVSPTLDFEIGYVGTTLCTTSTDLTNLATTLPLGAITSGTIDRNGYICTRLDTNAAGGASVYVTSNGKLASTSESGDSIPDAAEATMDEVTITSTAEEYGMCVESSGTGIGVGSGTAPTRDPQFDGADCTLAGSGTAIGELTTATEQVWSVSDTAENAFANLLVYVSVSSITEAHTDYADTLTFTVAATF